MRRTTQWAAGVGSVALLAGCREGSAERKQAEQAQARAETNRATQFGNRLQQQQVTNAVLPALKAAKEKDAAGLTSAVAELKKLGAPAVERLQADAGKGEKADRLAAVAVLAAMGADAAAAVPTLEGIAKDDADADLKAAAADAVTKIKKP